MDSGNININIKDRLHELISNAIATKNPVELEAILGELRIALKEYSEHTKNVAASIPSPVSPQEG
jgi:Tfp pilus assembly PilM family ATPase